MCSSYTPRQQESLSNQTNSLAITEAFMVVTTLFTIKISGFGWVIFAEHNAMNTVKILLEPGEEV